MSFNISGNKFGEYVTVILANEDTGESAEIACTGSTLLSYRMSDKNNNFNIIDGFADSDELKAARGARCWIMIPFANRIPEGKYIFSDKEYKMEAVPPRTQVIHGFASYMDYDIVSTSADKESAQVVFGLNKIRPGLIEGYPFALDILISFTLTKGTLTVEVSAENVGSIPAPFATGWHPYFKTSNEGIENLILTINADKIIMLDNNYIPLPGEKAYSGIDKFPELNFNDYLPSEKRIINNRVLDHCYANLKKINSGISECSLYNRENGLKITMFQYGGVTLAFSGDSLAQRKRKSVALEPMQFITNAFNRKEYADALTIMPGEKSIFRFGVRTETGK